MPFRCSAFLSLLLCLWLSGCGGGGGGNGSSGGTAPAPVNRAPVFSTAPINASVPENSADARVAVVVSDPDGTALSFSLSGEDAVSFVFNPATSELRLSIVPDFEAPADANRDNQYAALLRATDPGGLSATLSISVRVTDVTEPGDPVRYRNQVFSNVLLEDDVAFATVDGVTLRMSIYTPAGDAARDRPVIIIAPGGGFVNRQRASVALIAEDFARRGYVAATIDYRVLQRAPLNADELAVAGMKATHDLFAAVRFFRADGLGSNTRGVRPGAIFVAGQSSGGIMAVTAATLDPADTISTAAVQSFFDNNGGVYGTVGENDAVSSVVQGALAFSGGLLELGTIDAGSAVLYSAHEEFDPVVPCRTGPEGSSFTGLVVSGACDVVPAFTAAGAAAELYLVSGAAGHVNFTAQQRSEIQNGAAELFFERVIAPTP